MNIILAMLKKDMRILLDQRQALYAMLIVPGVLGVVMPLSLILSVLLNPEVSDATQAMFTTINPEYLHMPPDLQQVMMMVDNFISSYFLMIPIMSGSVLAATGFVTEREQKTMEALLYAPLSQRQLLTAKLLAALIPALLISWGSALLTGLAVNIPCLILRGFAPFPTPVWWLLLFWLLPILASLGLTFSVLVSANARTYQEAQQKSSMLVVPLVLLMVSQSTGLLSLNLLHYALAGAVLLVIELLLLRLIADRFQGEKLI